MANSQDAGVSKTESLDIEKLKSYGLPIMIDFGAEFRGRVCLFVRLHY